MSRWASVLGCSLLLASCQTAPGRSGAALPSGPEVVAIEMSEYRFTYPSDVAAGRVLFRLTNAGREPHSLVMVALADDIPPIEEQVRGAQRIAVQPFVEVAALQPGQGTTFAVDLVSGTRYAFLCFLADADRVSHVRKGMVSEFRAGEAGA